MRRSYAFRVGFAIALALGVNTAASAGPFVIAAGGDWKADAIGSATLGPDPSTGGFSGASGFLLRTEIQPNETGIARAEIPGLFGVSAAAQQGGILIVGKFVFAVAAGVDKMTGLLTISFPMGLTFDFMDGSGRFVSLNAGYSVGFPLQMDDSYFASVSTFALANSATDSDHMEDGPTTGVAASAATASSAAAPGNPTTNPQRFLSWGVSGLTQVTIDGNVVEDRPYAWGRSESGHVTADNVTATPCPDIPIPGTGCGAIGGFSDSFTFGSGTHTVEFTHTVSAFLQDRVIPEPSTMAMFGTGLVCVVAKARRRLKKMRRSL
jgi:hypothetical protein